MVILPAKGHRIARGGSAKLARQYAIIALVALLVEAVISSVLFILQRPVTVLELIPTIPIDTVLTDWISPFRTVCLVERRSARSLGLILRRERVGACAAVPSAPLSFPPSSWAWIVACCSSSWSRFRRRTEDAGLVSVELVDFASLVKELWEERQATDRTYEERPGCAILLDDPGHRLVRAIFTIHVRGEKQVRRTSTYACGAGK